MKMSEMLKGAPLSANMLNVIDANFRKLTELEPNKDMLKKKGLSIKHLWYNHYRISYAKTGVAIGEGSLVLCLSIAHKYRTP